VSCCDGKNVIVGHQSPDDVHLFPGVDAMPIGRKHQLQDLQFTFPPHDGNQLEYGRPTVLDNGDIEFRGGQKDPPELNGYYRDPQNPRLFHQLWGECAMRLSGSHTQPETGALTIKMICNHPETDTFPKADHGKELRRVSLAS
jgi:hypothetical protein